MADKLTNVRLRKTLKSVTRPQTGWLDVFPAVIGRADGTIQTGVPGIIYIRNLLNGQVLTVYNFVAPNTLTLQVEVGRKVETPGLWQVKGVREVYAVPAGGVVGSGSHTHDDLFVSRERYLPFLVFPIDGSGFLVNIYGDVIAMADGTFILVENQTLDLSTYVPTDGTAKWVLIEADADGVIHVTEGMPAASKEALTLADIPPVTAGRVASCAVVLYDGQEQLYRDPFSINDFVDLRALRPEMEIALSGLTDVTITTPSDGQILAYDSGTSKWVNVTEEIIFTSITGIGITSPADGQVLTYNSGSGLWENQMPEDGMKYLLMQDGVSSPPVPIETEDGTDWLYED